MGRWAGRSSNNSLIAGARVRRTSKQEDRGQGRIGESLATRHGGRRTHDCSALFLTSVVVELGKKRGQIGLHLLMGRVEKYLVIQNCILEGGAVAHFRLHYAPPMASNAYAVLSFSTLLSSNYVALCIIHILL
jgi:hypothetical protein